MHREEQQTLVPPVRHGAGSNLQEFLGMLVPSLIFEGLSCVCGMKLRNEHPAARVEGRGLKWVQG